MGGDGDRISTDRREARLKLEGEQQVGQLGLGVGPGLVVRTLTEQVIPSDAAHTGRHARHRDDSRSRAGEEGWKKPAGEREVAEMICAEDRLETVSCPREGDRHDAGIVDEPVDAPEPLEGFVGGCSDLALVCEVELEHLHRTGHPPRLDRGLGRRRLLQVTTGQHHCGTSTRECRGRLESDTGVGAGHDRGVTMQVGDVGGGPGRPGANPSRAAPHVRRRPRAATASPEWCSCGPGRRYPSRSPSGENGSVPRRGRLDLRAVRGGCPDRSESRSRR